MPAEAREDTAAGAIEFADYWFRALDWGYATTSSELARMYYLPICSDCAEFMKDFDETRRAGQHFLGGRVTIKDTTSLPNEHHNGSDVVVRVTISAAVLHTADNQNHILTTDPAINSQTYRLSLRWVAGHPYVVEFVQLVIK